MKLVLEMGEKERVFKIGCMVNWEGIEEEGFKWACWKLGRHRRREFKNVLQKERVV